MSTASRAIVLLALGPLLGCPSLGDQGQGDQLPRRAKQLTRLNLGEFLGGFSGLTQRPNSASQPPRAADPLVGAIGEFLGTVNVELGQDGSLNIDLGNPHQQAPPSFAPPSQTSRPATSTFPPFFSSPPPVGGSGSTSFPPFFPSPPPVGGFGSTSAPFFSSPRPVGGSGNCFERKVEYIGNDLTTVPNGIRNKQRGRRSCQGSCQRTQGCEYWVYVGGRARDRNLRRACFLKRDKIATNSNRRRVSGPKFCDDSAGPDVVRPPSPSPACRTVGGANVGARCQFPFRFQGRTFHGCTKNGAADGLLWCSTKVDSNGLHASGQGQWGHCPAGICPESGGETPIFTVAPPNPPPPITPPTVAPPNPPPPFTPPPTRSTTRRTRPPTPPPPIFPERQTRCGAYTQRFETKIVGGRPTDPDEWPWLAALVRPSTSSAGQFCGAALVSNQFVVTAAHCVIKFRHQQINVTLGEYDFKKKGETGDQTYGLASMKTHESYNRRTFENDIALLKLDRPVQFTKSIYPICLPPKGKSFEDTRPTVIGWGTIYYGGPTASLLQEVKVRVWSNHQCAENYGRLNRKVTDSMLCAGETGADACQGDSGGPLNCFNHRQNKWELCGVVSWGARCAEPDFPGVYTRTTSFLDWITSNMETL